MQNQTLGHIHQLLQFRYSWGDENLQLRLAKPPRQPMCSHLPSPSIEAPGRPKSLPFSSSHQPQLGQAFLTKFGVYKKAAVSVEKQIHLGSLRDCWRARDKKIWDTQVGLVL